MSPTYQTHLRVDVPVMQANCTFRALAHATGKSYAETRKILLAVVSSNHPEQRGVLWLDFCACLINLRIKPPVVFGTGQTQKEILRGSKLRGKQPTTARGCTLKTLLESGVVSQGRYIIGIREHAFALIDGRIYDHGETLKQNVHISAIWKVC